MGVNAADARTGATECSVRGDVWGATRTYVGACATAGGFAAGTA